MDGWRWRQGDLWGPETSPKKLPWGRCLWVDTGDPSPEQMPSHGGGSYQLPAGQVEIIAAVSPWEHAAS